MHIAIDGNEANVPHKVGVSVYTFRLLLYFRDHADSENRFTVFLRNPPRSDMPQPTEYFTYEVVKGPVAWSQIFLPLRLCFRYLTGVRYHLFFSPAHYIPRFSPFKTVVTIHDLSYLFFPQEFLKKDLYQLTNWTRHAIEKSQVVIAVSKTTKKDIVREYGTDEDKIAIIYNGYEKTESSLATQKQKKVDPYFLYVGTVQPRKNLKFLISAFAEFMKKHPTYKLLIAGKKGWLSDDIEPYVASLKLVDSVSFLGYVSQEKKDALYKGATAFILPSLYEGFGIPLLEAMANKCPVLSSYKSSLPEVGGEACLYFDPQEQSDLIEKMELVATDETLRKDLIQKGAKRAKAFSWDQTGEQTLQLLKSA